MKKLIQILVLSAVLTGCSKGGTHTSSSYEPDVHTSRTENPENNFKKVIKEGDLKFRTANNQETYSLISNALKGFGAYISNESTSSYDNSSVVDLTIRVPSEKFDSLLSFLATNPTIKKLDTKSSEITDVTEEYVDIQARMKIKKESEEKLVDLFRRAKNLTETLEVQKQLTELRAEIESIEARQKYLTTQINYSTLHVSFYEKIKYSNHFWSDFWGAIKDGWQVFLHVVVLLTYLWVVILVFLGVRWGYKFYKREFKRSGDEHVG